MRARNAADAPAVIFGGTRRIVGIYKQKPSRKKHLTEKRINAGKLSGLNQSHLGIVRTPGYSKVLFLQLEHCYKIFHK